MKKNIIILLFLSVFMSIGSIQAQQKLVIGSKMPSMRDVSWVTDQPVSSKPMLIEFYHSANPTSVKLFDKLEPIYSKYGNNIAVVVISRDNRDNMVAVMEKPYKIGLDNNGKVFENFGVQFIPFTMLFDSKGELFWQGNLNTINDKVLQSVN